MDRKKTLLMTMLLLFAFSALNVNLIGVSAMPVSPYIMVVPEKTIDYIHYPPGSTYTISIYTNYSGSDIWAWQFSLTYNPYLLQMGFDITDTWTGTGGRRFRVTKTPILKGSEEVSVNGVLMTRDLNYTIDYLKGYITFAVAPSVGAEVKATYIWLGVVNGDLINTAKDVSATFMPGTFDNTAGKLSLTGAYFDFMYPNAPPTTSGPGTLATVTFKVVGTEASDIILGDDTKLQGPPQPPDYTTPYDIINAKAMPDHIGNGYFENGTPKYAPIAAFTWMPETAIVNKSVTFDASASYDKDGNIESYAWDFGDGATGSGVTVTHVYVVEGTYYVTLTVTDNDGRPGTATATIYAIVVPPTIYLVDLYGKKAWPEHHHFVQSKELSLGEDLNITLYARVINNGTTGVLVQCNFTVYDSNGIFLVTLMTDARYGWIRQPGEKVDFSVLFDTTGRTGKFRVKVKILYDSDGDFIPDADGTLNLTKFFGFTVLP